MIDYVLIFVSGTQHYYLCYMDNIGDIGMYPLLFRQLSMGHIEIDKYKLEYGDII